MIISFGNLSLQWGQVMRRWLNQLFKHLLHKGLWQHGVGGVDNPSKQTRHALFNGGGLL